MNREKKEIIKKQQHRAELEDNSTMSGGGNKMSARDSLIMKYKSIAEDHNRHFEHEEHMASIHKANLRADFEEAMREMRNKNYDQARRLFDSIISRRVGPPYVDMAKAEIKKINQIQKEPPKAIAAKAIVVKADPPPTSPQKVEVRANVASTNSLLADIVGGMVDAVVHIKEVIEEARYNNHVMQVMKRNAEEVVYSKIASELQQRQLNVGLYTKAYAQSDGDEAKALSIYIRLRFQSLVDEA